LSGCRRHVRVEPEEICWVVPVFQSN
jgi:hypothetical protein